MGLPGEQSNNPFAGVQQANKAALTGAVGPAAQASPGAAAFGGIGGGSHTVDPAGLPGHLTFQTPAPQIDPNGAIAADTVVPSTEVQQEEQNPAQQQMTLSGAEDKSSEAIIRRSGQLYLADTLSDNGQKLFWKVACKSGTLALSPGPGQVDIEKPLELTPDMFAEAKRAFDERAFPHVTVPETHANGVLENTGFVRQLIDVDYDDPRLPEKIAEAHRNEPPGTKLLMTGIEFTEPAVRDKAENGSIADTSVGMKFNYRNKRTGKTYPVALEHVALTNVPWVDGLSAFDTSRFLSQEQQKGHSFGVRDFKGVYVEQEDDVNLSATEQDYEDEAPEPGEHFTPERASELETYLENLASDFDLTDPVKVEEFYAQVAKDAVGRFSDVIADGTDPARIKLKDGSEIDLKGQIDSFVQENMPEPEEEEPTAETKLSVQQVVTQISDQEGTINQLEDSVKNLQPGDSAVTPRGTTITRVDDGYLLTAQTPETTEPVQDGRKELLLRLSRSGSSGKIRSRGIQTSRNRNQEADMELEEIVARQQAEIERNAAEMATLRSDLSLSQEQVSDQAEALRIENVSKKIAAYQEARIPPVILKRAKAVMLADKPGTVNDEGSLSLSVQAPAASGDGTEEKTFTSATEVVEYMLSAMPEAYSVEINLSAQAVKNEGRAKSGSDAKLDDLDKWERKEHPERFKDDGKGDRL